MVAKVFNERFEGPDQKIQVQKSNYDPFNFKNVQKVENLIQAAVKQSNLTSKFVLCCEGSIPASVFLYIHILLNKKKLAFYSSYFILLKGSRYNVDIA